MGILTIELLKVSLLKYILKTFKMQITILGSTGQVGNAVLRHALNSGYKVKVLVRSSNKLNDLKEKVDFIEGDLLDSLAVERAIEGSSAIINAAGGVKEPDQYIKFQQIGKILAESVGEYFMLNASQMNDILTQIRSVVKDWRICANAIGIPKQEQDRMHPAFQF